MAGAPSPAGEDPLGGEHAVHVVRLGLRADHDHLLALLLGPPLGQVGVEGGHAHRRPGGDVQAVGQPDGPLAGLGTELRVQEEVHLIGRDPHHRLPAGDEALLGLVHGDAHRRLRGPLAVAGLQQPELAALDGELHVLHLPVVLLQPGGNGGELGVHLGHVAGKLLEGLGGPDAGHDVLALGVDQVVPFDLRLAAGGVARHGHPGGAVVAHVPEDHGLDVHRGAQVVGDAGRVAVVHGALAVPGLEDRLGGQAELLLGIGGEAAGQPAELGHDLLEARRRQLGIGGHALLRPVLSQHLLEDLVGPAQHHRAEHLHEAPVGVIHEALVTGEAGEAGGDLIVEADVEHRVHHPRHRELGPRPAGHQQWLLRIAEPLAGGLLHPVQRLLDLLPASGGKRLVPSQVSEACLGGHGEPGRHRHPQPGHLTEVGPLPPEEAAHALPIAAVALLGLGDLIEPVDPLGGGHGKRLSSSLCERAAW